MDWVMTGPQVTGVVCETFADFAASIRVMEKVGLSLVDTDLGRDIVRYAKTKQSSDVDLSEQRVLTLMPFSYPASHSVLHLLRWQWMHGTDLFPLVLFGWFIVDPDKSRSSLIGLVAFVIYSLFLIWRLVSRWREPDIPTLVQLRESGLFYATRSGIGSVIPWNTFTSFRVAKRGGLELWNRHEWYWIPPEAFTPETFAETTEFLIQHGVGTKFSYQLDA